VTLTQDQGYKRCVTCEESKSVGEYYLNCAAKDGFTTDCKECRKARSRAWREDNPERVAANTRRWYEANRERAAENRKRWDLENADRVGELSRRWHEENRDKKRAANRRWRRENPEKEAAKSLRYRERYPEKVEARNALNHAVRDGLLGKPERCSRCGMPTPHDELHGHHGDYSKPLEVEWLCVGCHNEIHNPD
jgi:hypothetical protein